MVTRAADKGRKSAHLYTPTLLALATRLADYPLAQDIAPVVEKRSQTCGSTVALALRSNRLGTVELGMQVTACAVGQASAAIMAQGFTDALLQGADHCSPADVASTFAAIERWLGDPDAPLPDWPGFAALEGARGYPARHSALLLPWRALLDALPTAGENG